MNKTELRYEWERSKVVRESALRQTFTEIALRAESQGYNMRKVLEQTRLLSVVKLRVALTHYLFKDLGLRQRDIAYLLHQHHSTVINSLKVAEQFFKLKDNAVLDFYNKLKEGE